VAQFEPVLGSARDLYEIAVKKKQEKGGPFFNGFSLCKLEMLVSMSLNHLEFWSVM
jgi:hypothetical protein